MTHFEFFGKVDDPYQFGLGGGVRLELLTSAPNQITLLNPFSFATIVLKGTSLRASANLQDLGGQVSEIGITDQDGGTVYRISSESSHSNLSLYNVLAAITRYQSDGDSHAFDRNFLTTSSDSFTAVESDRALTTMDSWIPRADQLTLSPFLDDLQLGDFQGGVHLEEGDSARANGAYTRAPSDGETIFFGEAAGTAEGPGLVSFQSTKVAAYDLKVAANHVAIKASGALHRVEADDRGWSLSGAEASFKQGLVTMDATSVRETISVDLKAGEKLQINALDYGSYYTLPKEGDLNRGIAADLDLQGEGHVILNVSYSQPNRSNFYSTDIHEDATLLKVDVAAGSLITSRVEFPGNATGLRVGKEVTLEVIGTSFTDLFIGGEEDDIFHPHLGNDIIDGGGGYDILRYKAFLRPGEVPHMLYANLAPDKLIVDMGKGIAKLTHGAKSYEQSFANIEGVSGTYGSDILIGSASGHHLSGEEGRDLIYGGDFNVWHHLHEANQIYRLYQAVFNRAPDIAGHHGWAETLAFGSQSLTTIVQGFMASQEFRSKYVGLTNEGFLELLYQNVLGRASDAAGLAHWMAELDGGAGRHNVVLGFANSSEFIKATSADASTFALSQDQSAQMDDLYRLYKASLAREPDLPGLKGWMALMGKGLALEAVARNFVDSPEFAATYGPLSNPDFIEQLYQNVLGRSSDAAGLTGWLARIEGGWSREEVLLGFSQSSEFIRKTQGGMREWVEGHGINQLEGGAGDDRLYSGLMADVFVFKASDKGKDIVMGFDDWDVLSFQGFGYESLTDLRDHLSDSRSGVVFSDQGVEVTIEGLQLAGLGDHMLTI